MIYYWCWAGRADVYPPYLCFLNDSLLSKFLSTSRAATRRALGHFDISFCPINLQIMFPEPGMSEYQFLFTQAGDAEGSLFRMIFVSEDETNGFSYGAGLVRGPVYIVDQNRASKFL